MASLGKDFFSRKSSKASSTQSLISLPEGDQRIGNPIEINVVEGNDRDQQLENDDDIQSYDLQADTELNPSRQFSFTNAHPMGKILINLLKDTTRLAEKTHLNTMDSEFQELCTNFYNYIQMDKRKANKKMLELIQAIKEEILNDELKGYRFDPDADPPSYFSPAPTLLTAQHRSDAMRLFPFRNRFSGVYIPGKSMDILEFLSLVRTAQDHLQLSEKEFKEFLLFSTTGKAHFLISEWIRSGESVATIFYNLLLHFDRRVSAEECKKQLLEYKAPKNSNLAKVEAHIMELAHRATAEIPHGPSRNHVKDLETISALIRCLPINSAMKVQSLYNTMNARRNRTVSAQELSLALHAMRHAIDRDIKDNGAVPASKNRNAKLATSLNKNRFATYAIAAEIGRAHV